MSKTISSIVVCCFKKDLHLLRICLGSIRFWHPEIPIYLLKDSSQGKFNTTEMEDTVNASCFPCECLTGGWGLTKIESLFADTKEKVLLLDSDTVLLGPVLERLEQYDEDFIATGIEEENSQHSNVIRDYINTESIQKKFDPHYRYPGFAFNTGQIVITRGIFTRDDFSDLIEFSDTGAHTKISDSMMRHADQGILNYAIAKKAAAGKTSVRYDDFWLWSGLPEVKNDLSVKAIASGRGYPKILHWAGTKKYLLKNMDRFDILDFFETFYYGRLSSGLCKKHLHHALRLYFIAARSLQRRCNEFTRKAA